MPCQPWRSTKRSECTPQLTTCGRSSSRRSRPDGEKAAALRRAQPFVTVAGVEVRADRIQVEVELARPVGAVDDADDPGLARTPAQLLDREADRRRRADVAEEERRVCAPVTPPHTVSTISSALVHGTGTRPRHPRRPRPLARVLPRERQAPYSWSVESTSSPGPSASERATVFTPVVAFGKNAIPSGSAPMNAAELPPHVVEQALEPPVEQLNRVPLQLALPRLVRRGTRAPDRRRTSRGSGRRRRRRAETAPGPRREPRGLGDRG